MDGGAGVRCAGRGRGVGGRDIVVVPDGVVELDLGCEGTADGGDLGGRKEVGGVDDALFLVVAAEVGVWRDGAYCFGECGGEGGGCGCCRCC